MFDPFEVTPEIDADVGVKKGEKVDYAILKDGKPVMLFECKTCNASLDECHASQLYRYFSVTPARVGVLTNGVVYRFFSDLEAPNKMDSQPFLEVNLRPWTTSSSPSPRSPPRAASRWAPSLPTPRSTSASSTPPR
jgi:hypothetical protein